MKIKYNCAMVLPSSVKKSYNSGNIILPPNDGNGNNGGGGGGGGDGNEYNFSKLKSSQVKTLVKHWYTVTSKIGTNNENDTFLYKSYAEMKSYTENNRDGENDLYLSWSPKISKKTSLRADNYFIVACRINPLKKILEVNLIAPNPLYIYASNIHIPTSKFKEQIEKVAKEGGASTNYFNLSNFDIRYQLEFNNLS